jgi:transcriptional regulator with XRE-family HTH domain
MRRNKKGLQPNKYWQFRKRMRLGQKQLAHLLGHRSLSHISEWEHGLRVPNLDNIIYLEKALKAPIYALYPEKSKEADKMLETRFKRLPKIVDP